MLKISVTGPPKKKKRKKSKVQFVPFPSFYFPLPRLGPGDIFTPLPPSFGTLSVCVPWLTAAFHRFPGLSVLARGFKVVVEARGHGEGRGVIMKSSPQLLLPNLPSSPFVSLCLYTSLPPFSSPPSCITASCRKPLFVHAYQVLLFAHFIIPPTLFWLNICYSDCIRSKVLVWNL